MTIPSSELKKHKQWDTEKEKLRRDGKKVEKFSWRQIPITTAIALTFVFWWNMCANVFVVTFMSDFIKGTIRNEQTSVSVVVCCSKKQRNMQHRVIKLSNPQRCNWNHLRFIFLLIFLFLFHFFTSHKSTESIWWLQFYLKFNRNNLQFNLSLVEGNVVASQFSSIGIV